MSRRTTMSMLALSIIAHVFVAFAGHVALVAPALADPMITTWNFSSNIEGWTGRNGTNVRWSGDGGGRLYVDTYGNDPGIVSPPLSMSASTNDLLRMYIWTYCADQNCTVYFMRSGSSTIYTGGTLTLTGGSGGATYELGLSGNPDWTGTITQIRIDPAGYCGSASSPGFVAFDWIQTSDFTPTSIQVTSPNGGEVWTVGSTQRFQWTNPGGYSSFNIDLSRDGGATWANVFNGLPNTYYYRDWTVTGPASGNVRARVVGYYSGGSSSDVSNANFTICQPDVDVAYPNGGQTLWMGHSCTVTWTTTSCTDSSVKIELYRGTSTMVHQFESGTPNDGSQTVVLPVDGTLVAASDYRFAISAPDGDPWDFSDSYFTISKPTISVTAPSTGSSFGPGAVVPISWSWQQVLGNVHIEIYKDEQPYQVVNSSAPNTGSSSWTVPSDAPTSSCYKVGISAMSGHVYAYSGCFTINGCTPAIDVTYPDGGQTLYLGHDCNVSWTSSACMNENVKIELYKGTSMVHQFESGTANDGTQTVNFPVDGAIVAGSDYRIAISAVDMDPWNFSASYFSLVKPTITATAPAGGANFDPGDSCPIVWTSNMVLGVIQIDLYANDTMLMQLAAGAPNTGNMAWTIPTLLPAGSRYQIGLSAMGGHVYGFTDYFTVGTPPTFGFDYPVGYPDGGGYNHTAGWDWLEWTGTVWHPGEDWNGNGGGDSDLGDSVYAVADGVVTQSGNYGAGWGNITVIRHDLPGGETVWSQYGHLQTRTVTSGAVSRGQVIGTIGKGYNNEYWAHLHFEIRKQDLAPDAWPTGWSIAQIEAAYHHPSAFISSHRGGDAPVLALTSPIGGEIWRAGETHDITWISSGITGTIQVQPYLGETPLTNIAAGAPNTGLFQWTIPVDWSPSTDYRIGISANAGTVSNFGNEFTVLAWYASGVETELPRTVTLYDPSPNPFNPITTIRFALPERSAVNLSVFDLSGKLVDILIEDDYGRGSYSAQWRGTDIRGERVASGVYLARLTTGDVVRTVKLLLSK